MRVLVTGGAGYIGSHTVVELCEAGFDVTVVDNFVNSKPEAVRRTQMLCDRPVDFIYCDLRDRCRNSFCGFKGCRGIG